MIIQILLFSIVCEIFSLPDPHRGGISEINYCLESCNVCEIENPAGMVETAKIGGGSVSGHYHEARLIVNAHDVFRFNHHGAFPILTVKNCGFLPLISRHFKKVGITFNILGDGQWPSSIKAQTESLFAGDCPRFSQSTWTRTLMSVFVNRRAVVETPT